MKASKIKKPVEEVPQSDKFKAIAKEIGADSDEKIFDKALLKVARPKTMPKKE